jgi:hypothetical protein
MRGTLGSLAALAAAEIRAPAHAPQAAPPVRVEVRVTPQRVMIGEPITVEWEVSGSSAWLADHALQPFHQPLDAPFAVDAVALDRWTGVTSRDAPAAAADRAGTSATLALNGRRVTAIRELRGDDLRLTLRREFLAEAVGPLEFPASTLRLTWTSGFDDDLLGGRSARDRHEWAQSVKAVALEVVPWPQPSPPGFGGAVGILELDASVSAREIVLGDPVTLSVTFRGDANFEQFEVPPFAPEGFHVRGRTIERHRGRLVASFELLPRSTAVAAVPPLSIDWLEPGAPPRWRRGETGASALTVRPRGDGATTLDIDLAPPIDPAVLELLSPQKLLDGSRSDPSATWFERGELARRAARDGDFAAAVRWWRAALGEAGAPVGVIRFNLGHAEFARGRRIEALREWLAAAPALRGDRDLRANLRLVAKELGLPATASDSIERWCDGGGQADVALVIVNGATLHAEPSRSSQATPVSPPMGALFPRRGGSSRWVELLREDGAPLGWIERDRVALLP